jgi:hypothetical protein
MWQSFQIFRGLQEKDEFFTRHGKNDLKRLDFCVHYAHLKNNGLIKSAQTNKMTVSNHSQLKSLIFSQPEISTN